jgi:hypothetical protein
MSRLTRRVVITALLSSVALTAAKKPWYTAVVMDYNEEVGGQRKATDSAFKDKTVCYLSVRIPTDKGHYIVLLRKSVGGLFDSRPSIEIGSKVEIQSYSDREMNVKDSVGKSHRMSIVKAYTAPLGTEFTN